VAKEKAETPGDELEYQLFQALKQAQNAPLLGARDLPVMGGLDRQGTFTDPQENVLVRATEILVGSAQVFTYGNSVVMQRGEPTTSEVSLAALRSGTEIETSARGILANLFICQHGERQFPPPKWFLEVLLHAQPVLAALPRIQLYVRRPILSKDFALLTPGWHPESGVLVHGPAVELIMSESPDPDLSAIDRLPHHLHNLLGEFCFRTEADLVNAVAMLITGLLMNHFLTQPKALFPVDGNQPSLGKTLLLRVTGIILDGADPRLVPFSEDEEEQHKRICASVRNPHLSVLIIDNAKTAVGKEVKSPVIKSMSMAPEISLRILGKSENFTRPNDLLWTFSMNNSRFCIDLIARSCPIRLYYCPFAESRAT